MQLVLATALAIVSMHQVYCEKTPTMDGGNCTQEDMATFSAVFVAPVWANCTSVTGATLKESNLEGAESIKTLCGSATCTAFLSSLEKQVPNCMDRSMNLKAAFQRSLGCTPAASGAQCSLIDSVPYITAAATPVWANCSSFLKLPEDASIKDIVLDRDANATSLPTGFCNSTCPQYVLSVIKSQPSCIMGDTDMSDPTFLYKLCPNVKPENKSGASTLSVFLWSYVVVLVTAVATLF